MDGGVINLRTSDRDLVAMLNPYENWPIDTKILVWGSDGVKYKYHFAAVGDKLTDTQKDALFKVVAILASTSEKEL